VKEQPVVRTRLLALVFLVSTPALADDAQTPSLAPDPLPLAWCLERAERSNPALAAEASAADAARHRIASAGALEDPRFRYEASNVPIGSWDFNSTPLSGHQLTLAQKIPFPGLLGKRRAAAEAGADAAAADLADRRVAVAAGVERAWVELGFAQRAVEITDRNLELLRQLVRIAEARYRVGSGLQQDILRAHVELTSLLQQRLRRVAETRSAEARLAGMLDFELETPLPRTADLVESTPLPELKSLLMRVDDVHPRLRAATARVEEARRRRQASQLEGYPDFDLGLGYRIRSRVAGDLVEGDDFLTAGVTLRLPVNRNRWRAHVAESEALLRRSEAMRRGVRAELRDRLRSNHAELVRAEDELSLIATGLIPQASQSLESSRAAYEVGRVDFPALLDAQVNLLEAELRLARAQAGRRTAWAGLEASVGEGLR
jgi:cobalt-zinc-cadmium efflux system outer membrane protein